MTAAKESTMEECEDRVEKMFNGKSIFITGGSGFLGKVMLEKIFRYIVFLFFLYNVKSLFWKVYIKYPDANDAGQPVWLMIPNNEYIYIILFVYLFAITFHITWYNGENRHTVLLSSPIFIIYILKNSSYRI